MLRFENGSAKSHTYSPTHREGLHLDENYLVRTNSHEASHLTSLNFYQDREHHHVECLEKSPHRILHELAILPSPIRCLDLSPHKQRCPQFPLCLVHYSPTQCLLQIQFLPPLSSAAGQISDTQLRIP